MGNVSYGKDKWLSDRFRAAFGPARHSESDIDQRHMDIAAALQLRTEEVCLHIARHVRQATGRSRVCLAGGVCLNSVMNGRLLAEGVFDDVWVQPAANDAGCAIGACYWLWNTVMRQPRSYVMEHAY